MTEEGLEVEAGLRTEARSRLQSLLPSTVRTERLLVALAGRWRLGPILVSLAGIWLFFWSQQSIFISSQNLTFLSVQIVVTSMVGLGVFFVLVIGEIDLAVAVTSGVSAAVAGSLAVHHGVSAGFALAVAIAVGAGIGAIQGAVIVFFGAPSFIVTLGVSLALTGVLLQILGTSGSISLIGEPLTKLASTYLPDWLSWTLVSSGLAAVALLKTHAHIQRRRHGLQASLARGVILPAIGVGAGGAVVVLVLDGYEGVPTPVAILLGLLAVCSYVTTQTSFGLHLYAIGTSREASVRAGIAVSQVRLVAFMLTGAFAALAGVIAAGRVLAVASEAADPTLLLEAIAAAVIGGVSLFGGRGSVWGPLIGGLVIGSISNGMLLINASTQSRLEVEGAIMVLAVTVDAVLTRMARTA